MVKIAVVDQFQEVRKVCVLRPQDGDYSVEVEVLKDKKVWKTRRW